MRAKSQKDPRYIRAGVREITDRSKRSVQRKGLLAIANRLTALGYTELFQGTDEGIVDAIWNEPEMPEALARLALDSKVPTLARFLAAEIIFQKRTTYPPEKQKEQLASVYGAALAQNFTGVANPWGLPGLQYGSAGENFLALGDFAILELKTLLNDGKRIFYEGSEEATIADNYQYRVKDLAAFYISQVKVIPLELDENSSNRDKEIEKLRRVME